MRDKGTRAFAAISLLLLLAALVASALVKVKAFAAVGVLTQHNDNGRSGANLNETILNTSNVNVAHFGKLFSRQVDGFIYGQPLYVPNLTIPGSGSHNVVFVATEHNSVYGFDADDPNAVSPLWQVNLGTSVPSADIDPSYMDLIPEIGITSTPVIDTGTNTIYVVAKTRNLADSTYHQKLHALDISTGAEKDGGPVEIVASIAATGGGSVTFDPYLQLNRPGLLFLNGVVYMAFGSQGDRGAYHGWVLGYNASTLQQVSAFNTTPDAVQGAVWHGGGGLASDGSNIYLSTGNGTFDLDHGGRDYGDSVLKLGAGALTVGDWFTPWNQSSLNMTDSDLGSGGPLLLPGTNLLVVCGKDGLLRLINTASMGHFDPAVNHDVQEFQAVPVRFFGSPIYWNSPGGPQIYMWGTEDVLKAFSFAGGVFNTTPGSQSTMAVTSGYTNVVPLSLSASGSQSGSGIVWACAPFIGDSNRSTVPGIVRAFDAGNVGVELWNSMQNQARDDIGNYAKFCPPTISNGKVYVASFSGRLHVFGLLPLTCTFSISPQNIEISAGGGSGMVNVTAPNGCNWMAASNNTWINITSGSSGSGNGSVGYSVTANTGQSRTGSITIAGQTFTIMQDAPCTYSISPAFAKFRPSGGSGSISVTAPASCNWSATSPQPWVTITSGATGQGNGMVHFTVQPSSGAPRTVSLTVAGQSFSVVQTGASSATNAFDFDDDGKADLAVWRGSTGDWRVIDSSTGAMTTTGWGLPGMGDVPVPGDYDGDGKTDLAIWRASTGVWWIINSSNGAITSKSWGLPGMGDVPVPGDYDGDGKTDLAIWRASTGTWWIINSSTGAVTTKGWGLQEMGDIPVPGDYDGDGKTDLAIWRASTGTWWVIDSSTGAFTATGWGLAGMNDVPVPGDYDGDGKTDVAIWRGSTGTWWIINSSNGAITTKGWGLPGMGDVPVPADYDGDGKTDVAIWRGSTGDWWIVGSLTGNVTRTNWGLASSGDIPIPAD
jgi:hypothetical protein